MSVNTFFFPRLQEKVERYFATIRDSEVVKKVTFVGVHVQRLLDYEEVILRKYNAKLLKASWFLRAMDCMSKLLGNRTKVSNVGILLIIAAHCC